jgi:hypothetical protein
VGGGIIPLEEPPLDEEPPPDDDEAPVPLDPDELPLLLLPWLLDPQAASTRTSATRPTDEREPIVPR